MSDLHHFQGHKKGGGNSPSEDPDSLRSLQTAQVVDLLSEGEIKGLVNGLKSVYFDGVPVENADGSRNFEGLSFAYQPGTQGQPSLEGFDTVQNERAVGVVITAITPVTQTILNPDVDTVRVTISVPQLSKLDANSGNLHGSQFTYAIEIQSHGGGFVEKHRETVSGKTTRGYKRATRIALTGTGPWDIRVKRISVDSGSSAEQNAFSWDTFTEIQSVQLRYPNSAVAGIQVSARQFSRIPSRAYDILGLVIRVPSNYDPIAGTYSGTWNGTFKMAWSNNPAWVFYDLATHPRYGCGRYLKDHHLDKWQLYAIGRYCDERVSDGMGGTEPRFTCNLYLQTEVQARRALQDLASLFRAIAFWGHGGIGVVQDSPADAQMLFTPANVVGGTFRYESVSRKKRHSVWTVYYNDLTLMGRRQPLVYRDPDLIRQFGEVHDPFAPIGCTSRGQALRLARWAALSEQLNRTISFRAGAIAEMLMPGAIIKVSDPQKAGKRLGGRIRTATANQLTLDAPVTLEAGKTYQLEVLLVDAAQPSGYRTEKRQVTTGAGEQQVLAVAPAFSSAPSTSAIWVLQPTDIEPTWWRLIGRKPVDGTNEHDLIAIEYDPDKFTAIEQGLKLAPKPTSGLTVKAPLVTQLAVLETTIVDVAVPVICATVSWTEPARGLRYRVSWRINGGAWTRLPDTSANSVDIQNLQVGVFEVQVQSVNALGVVSAPVPGSLGLQGKLTGPEVVVFTANVTKPGVVRIGYQKSVARDYASTSLRVGDTWATAAPLPGTGDVDGYDWSWPAIGSYTVWAVHTNNSGRSSDPASTAVTVDASILVGASYATTGRTFFQAEEPFTDASYTLQKDDLWIDRGSVNLTLWSEQFDNAAWQKNLATVTPNSTVAPDGTTTADTVAISAGGFIVQGVTMTIAAGDKVTWSLHSTASAFSSFGFGGATPAGTDVYDAHAIGGGWYRHRVTRTFSGATASANVQPILRGTFNGVVWGAQLERLAKPGRYLPTTSSQASTPAANRLYVWSGTAWSAADDARIASAISAAATAQTTANTAASNASSALSTLQAMRSNGILDAGEKPALMRAWQAITQESDAIYNQGTAYGALTERNAYGTAYAALSSYLSSLSPAWNDTNSDTPITPAIDQAKWSDYYTAREQLLRKISELAGLRATWTSVAGRPADDAIRNNLVDLAWWKRGASIPWAVNGEENAMLGIAEVGGSAPKGASDVVWFCREVTGNGEQGGGWDATNTLTLDPSRTHRFIVPIKVRTAGAGSAYWGIQPGSVCNVNTTVPNGNPYFAYVPQANLQTDRWYLFVGYVFPYGSTQNLHDGAGVYDCKTGALVVQGSNWNHGPTGAAGHRAYQYYASVNASQLFGRPVVNVVDGSEPPLREFFEPTALLNSVLEPSIANAQTTANTAASNAAAALNSLQAMRSNGILDAGEKPALIREWNALQAAHDGIYSQATALGATAERDAWQAKHEALSNYLGGLSPSWSDTTVDTPITPAVDQARWTEMYATRQALLNKIADIASKSATWSNVTGAGKPADYASSDVSLIGQGSVVIEGNGATKTAGGAGWNAAAYSRDAYLGGSFCSVVAVANNEVLFGLNDNAANSASWEDIDFGINLTAAGTVVVYESGSSPGTFGTYAAGDVLAVAYDGSTVRYLRNGTVFHSHAALAGLTLRFDSSIYFDGHKLRGVRYGPMSANNWAAINGRPKTFIVRAQGSSATPPAGWWNGLRNAETGAELWGVARSWLVCELDRSGNVVYAAAYDVYSSATTAAQLRDDLNFICTNRRGNVIVIYSFDEPQAHLWSTSGLPQAIARCGGSLATLRQLKYRSSYILIGLAGGGEGTGADFIAGAVDADPAAWCERSFSLANGTLIVSGGNGGPKSVMDLDYVGDLAATRNPVYYQETDPGSVPNGSIWIASTGSWQRVGGTWQPYVPNGSVSTDKIGANAVTLSMASTSTNTYPIGINQEASVGIDGIYYTPSRDCVADVTTVFEGSCDSAGWDSTAYYRLFACPAADLSGTIWGENTRQLGSSAVLGPVQPLGNTRQMATMTASFNLSAGTQYWLGLAGHGISPAPGTNVRARVYRLTTNLLIRHR